MLTADQCLESVKVQFICEFLFYMKKRTLNLRMLIVFAVAFLQATFAHAWSECGHHIVAVLAYDQLTAAEKSELQRILIAHPRYAEDFAPADKIASTTGALCHQKRLIHIPSRL